jgi:twitching motility two-component system response regulator PilG
MSGISEVLRNGIAAAQAREFDQARPLLEQATAESPDDPIGWFWLAIASPTGGAAIPCLRRVLEIDPSHEQSKAALAKLLMAEAVSVATAGNRAEARALVAEAARIIPGEQAVWLRLAATTDDPDERIFALRQAMAISADDAVRTRLRQALLWRGLSRNADRAVARASFREAAELDPTDPRVWQALASLADTPAEAVDALRELLRVAPNHPNGRGALRNAIAADAYALAGAELVDAACLRWREIMDLTGGDVETWLGIAATTSDQEEAERAVKTAFKLKPTDERAAAAMERLRRSKIDPATAEPPSNAFGRFEVPASDCAALEPSDDALPPLEFSLEAFAPLPMPEIEAPSEIGLDLLQAPEAPPSEVVLELSQTPEPSPSEVVIELSQTPEPSPSEVVIELSQTPEPPPSELVLDLLQTPEPPAEIVLDLSQLTDTPAEAVPAFVQTAESPSEAVPALLQTAEPPTEAVPALVQTAEPPSEMVPALQQAAEPPSEAVPAVLQTAEPQSEIAPVIPPAADPQPALAVAAATVAPVPEAPAIVPPPVAPAEAAPASMAATDVERPSNDTSRRTVMVVDDSPTIRQILGLTLKRAGYTVVAEPDGLAAIERLTQMVPDLILLDIAMPKLDGYEVCKRIKLDPRTAGVPIVMLSGKGAFFDKVKGHMAGATEYLTKPFETPAVLAVVTGFCPPPAEALHG